MNPLEVPRTTFAAALSADSIAWTPSLAFTSPSYSSKGAKAMTKSPLVSSRCHENHVAKTRLEKGDGMDAVVMYSMDRESGTWTTLRMLVAPSLAM